MPGSEGQEVQERYSSHIAVQWSRCPCAESAQGKALAVPIARLYHRFPASLV
jgi:hypothetical protein